MAFQNQARVPRTPTLPQGEQVAVYGTYLEAQRAVDHLADKQFAVQLVTIVGLDLRMVERVTGRLSYPRVALAGLASGAWFGLFVGFLLLLFSSPDGQTVPLIASILIGAAFGMLFSVVTYSFTGGKRDFTSQSQIVAASYAVLCAAEQAHKARALLQEIGGTTSGWPTPPTPVAPVTRPSDPQAAYPPAAPVTPSGGPTVPPAHPAQPTQPGHPGQPGQPPHPGEPGQPTQPPYAAPGGSGATAAPGGSGWTGRSGGRRAGPAGLTTLPRAPRATTRRSVSARPPARPARPSAPTGSWTAGPRPAARAASSRCGPRRRPGATGPARTGP